MYNVRVHVSHKFVLHIVVETDCCENKGISRWFKIAHSCKKWLCAGR